MNQDAKPNTASNPAATPAAGLKSALKIALPLALLMGVVFAITYFSQYTPPSEPGDGKEGGPDAATTQPLAFFSSTRSWDPPNLSGPYRDYPMSAPSAHPSKFDNPFDYSLQDRLFQGFYEPSPHNQRLVSFWFQNRHPNAVTVQLKRVSCLACSGGKVASIPPEVTRNILQHTAVSMLPSGLFNGLPVGMVGPAAQLERLEWEQHTFLDNPNATFKVKAAPENADGWSPQWGILALTFTVGDNDKSKTLQTQFATAVDGTQIQGTNDFAIVFEGAQPFELSQPVIDAGTLDDLSGDREYPVLMYSSTRGPGSEFGDLAPPTPSYQVPGGGGDPGKFVEVTKVERVPEAELIDVAAEVARQQKRLVKVRAAYRLTVAVHPKVGDARLDIGHLSRTITLTSGTGLQTMTVKAVVRGAVWLQGDRTEIEVPTFKTSDAVNHQVRLVTQTTGLKLAVVPDECRPKGFKYELEKLKDDGGQGYYQLRVVVPPGSFSGGAIRGVVVLEVTGGPNPQRIRIPVNGLARY
jgi:hypothetical protein